MSTVITVILGAAIVFLLIKILSAPIKFIFKLLFNAGLILLAVYLVYNFLI